MQIANPNINTQFTVECTMEYNNNNYGIWQEKTIKGSGKYCIVSHYHLATINQRSHFSLYPDQESAAQFAFLLFLTRAVVSSDDADAKMELQNCAGQFLRVGNPD